MKQTEPSTGFGVLKFLGAKLESESLTSIRSLESREILRRSGST
jgi:hypothetical protein